MTHSSVKLHFTLKRQGIHQQYMIAWRKRLKDKNFKIAARALKIVLSSRAKFTNCDMLYIQLYLRINFRRCLHVETSSLRLFRVAMCGLVIKKNFSVVHRLQRFVMLVYGFALARIFHVILNSVPSSFNCHRCLLSSVSFLLFSCLNDIWWFLYLVLNWLAVRPMYVSFVFRVVTVAWYTTSFARHSPLSGHSSFFLQLHVFSSSCCCCAVSKLFNMNIYEHLWTFMNI